MIDDLRGESERKANELSQKIAKKVLLKLKARQKNAANSVWTGLGMTGLIGWSVVVPTLIGIAVGIWLDHSYPTRISWTLSLLVIGLVIGCLNAWYWVSKEEQEIREE